jgi:tripartite-type tricarboxylate transporter receptor subunit TctC
VLVKFRGLAGPKGLSPALVKLWDEAAQKVLADPEFKKAYLEDNLAPHFIAHDQYGPFITQFATDTATFLKSTGVIR